MLSFSEKEKESKQGLTGLGGAWRGKAGRGRARQGKARQGI